MKTGQKDQWLALMTERYWWFRFLLHLYMTIRQPHHVRWHLNCAWREIYERFN